MAIHITMPALSPTMEEGTLAKWLVAEGDSVASGDVIAEIETDKATMEVEAVDEGVISKILIAGGTAGVAVNTPIAILALEDENPKSTDVGDAKAAPADEKVDTPAQEKQEAVKATPAPSAAPELKVIPTPSGERVFSSPLARRIAKESGIDIAQLAGSGPRGRVVRRDVEAAVKNGGTAKASTASQSGTAFASGVASGMASGMSDDAVKALYEASSYEEKPHDGMRRAIASRLTESTQTIPSYTVNMACRLDNLMSTRAQINSGAPLIDDKPAYKVSVNDFIIKALALALRDVPMANASWTSDARLLHQHSDVGVAVAIDDGLITPIVRQAETKSLTEISAEVKDLARRARDKKLSPSEYQGGTSSVSNLGMFGVSDFTSIINPPQASIVSIGAGIKQAVVGDNGELEVGTMMNATFAFDHRVIDGALGAQLGVAFKNYIENPLSMLV